MWNMLSRKEQKPLIKTLQPAVPDFTQEARKMDGFTFFDWLHGYVYLRWPYLYIGVATGAHPLTRIIKPLASVLSHLIPSKPNNGEEQIGFADSYHGKVVTLDAATQLVSIKEDICLENLEQIIPYTRARDIILKNPDHIVVLECPCRSSRTNPCFPLDVCLIVGEPFVSQLIKHHPDRSRWVSSSEAADILQAEHDRGHVHHAFFKDAMLDRFYAICNCCSCCCAAMQSMRNGTPMLCSSGFVSTLDQDLCTGCHDCIDVCPFEAITLNETLESDGTPTVNQSLCMGCGVCVDQCVEGAYSLTRNPDKGEPLIIHELMASGGAALS